MMQRNLQEAGAYVEDTPGPRMRARDSDVVTQMPWEWNDTSLLRGAFTPILRQAGYSGGITTPQYGPGKTAAPTFLTPASAHSTLATTATPQASIVSRNSSVAMYDDDDDHETGPLLHHEKRHYLRRRRHPDLAAETWVVEHGSEDTRVSMVKVSKYFRRLTRL